MTCSAIGIATPLLREKQNRARHQTPRIDQVTKRSKCVQSTLGWGMADIPGSEITKPFNDLLVCGMNPIGLTHKYGIKRSWII